jgi:large subunit ribosomal protein L35
MAKVKTKSAAKKRFKKVGNNKIKRGKAFRRHLLKHKSTKRKRQLRKGGYVSASDARNISALLS